MARVRSPNYPAIGLPEAIRRVEAIYKQEHQNPAPREVLVRHMGFSGVNGASLGVLSALAKYGLLEPAGDKELRVSSLALEILYPESDERKATALAQAASQPPLFQEFRERWPDRLPSDDSLKAYLVRRGFGQSALDGVIRSFRETVGLVNDSEGDYGEALSSKRDGREPDMEPAARSAAKPVPPGSAPDRLPPGKFKVSVTDDSLLDVSASQLDSEGLERLIHVLQANKSVLRTASAAARGRDDSVSDGVSEEEAGA